MSKPNWYKNFLAAIRRLNSVPKDGELFVHFEQMITLIQSSSEKLHILITSEDNDICEKALRTICQNEKSGDGVQSSVSKFTGSSFCPPFPSQDITILTSALDDILDSIKDAANNYFYHGITAPPEQLIAMAEIIRQLGEIFTVEIIDYLRKFQHPNHIYSPVISLEGKADDIKNMGIPKMIQQTRNFEEYKKAKAVSEVIKALERATNMFEKALKIIEGVISKSV